MKKTLIFSCILIVIDFVIKLLITTNMSLNQEIIIINNFLSIFYVKNSGAAFSILVGYRIIFVLLASAVLAGLINMVKNETKFTRLNTSLYALLIAGVTGNLIDRVVYGGVIDYISFIFFNYRFAVFNLADSFIVVAVSIYIIATLLKKEVFKI